MNNVMARSLWVRRLSVSIVLLMTGLIGLASAAKTNTDTEHTVNKDLAAYEDKRITLSLRDLDISEVMKMLSRNEKVNILLSKGVSGMVSVNLFNVSLDDAIHSIASAAGFGVERRNSIYYILKQEDVGKHTDSGLTQIKTFKIQYSDPVSVEKILTKYLSRYGSLTIIKERKLLVVEDMPANISRIERLLREVDRQPQQILIEAKILEITLDDTESFGLDWKRVFSEGSGSGEFGGQGLGSSGSPGFFFSFVHPKVELYLNALKGKGRVRTLSTPKLLALENEEASVIIGDRIGYKVTTTINQVTTESIEFLESGVILKVKPSVDNNDKVMLNIHPEVSTGTITSGIPSQTTTEVTTQLLVPNGQTIFIGGLMKNRQSESRDGVPLLSDIPGVGRLFANSEQISINTETIVLITPYIVDTTVSNITSAETNKVKQAEIELTSKSMKIEEEIVYFYDDDEGD